MHHQSELRMKVDLSRPDYIYAAIWGVVYSLSYFVESNSKYDFSPEISALVLGNIISFFVVYKLVGFFLNGSKETDGLNFQAHDFIRLKDFTKLLLKIWIPLYLLNVVVSDGLPAYWVIIGDPRTYVDYGIPTMSGFLNMIRAFMFSVSIMLFLKSKNKKELYLPVIFIATSILEVSRGGLTVLLLHGVGMYVLCKKNSIGTLFLMLVGLVLFILIFGWLADFRGGHVSIEDIAGNDSIFVSLPTGFFWVYTYITTPINNVNYAYSMGIEPLYYPYFSIMSLLPTVIRGLVFPDTGYPIALAVDAFNATSFYSPLLADFGLIGAGLVVVLLQIVVSYVHLKAANGCLFHFLLYPVLYMCILLSTFYMFFFSMVTIMYPFVAYACTKYNLARRGKKNLQFKLQ